MNFQAAITALNKHIMRPADERPANWHLNPALLVPQVDLPSELLCHSAEPPFNYSRHSDCEYIAHGTNNTRLIDQQSMRATPATDWVHLGQNQREKMVAFMRLHGERDPAWAIHKHLERVSSDSATAGMALNPTYTAMSAQTPDKVQCQLPITGLIRPAVSQSGVAAGPKALAIYMVGSYDAALAGCSHPAGLQNLPVRWISHAANQGSMRHLTSTGNLPAFFGGCYTMLVPTSAVPSTICELVATGYEYIRIPDTYGNLVSRKVNIGHLQVLRPMTSQPGGAAQTMLDSTKQKHGTWIAVTVPMMVGLEFLGGDPDRSSHDLPYADLDPFAPLALDASILKKIAILPTHIDTTIDKRLISDAVFKGTNQHQGLPGIDPRTVVCPNGDVDLRGQLMLVTEKHTILEQQPGGCLMSSRRMTSTAPPAWPYAEPRNGVVCELAPAFAAINAIWLDRNALSALTAAANWAAGSRSAEIEPQVRTALRTAAGAPIELTRIYVRLWAMYLSATKAEVSGNVYQPRLAGRPRHVINTMSTYHEWAGMLTLVTNRHTNCIYFDAHATGAIEDILPVLMLATAINIIDAGYAQWLWPTTGRLRLATNTHDHAMYLESTSSTAVLATIHWLANSSGTAEQSKHAKGLAYALMYDRDSTRCAFPVNGSDKLLVPLPQLSTAGQFISPLCLWNTTASTGGMDDAISIPDPCEVLLEAALASATYLYCVSQACLMTMSPRWWPTYVQKMYARRDALISDNGQSRWYPGHLAARVAEQIGWPLASGHLLNVRPNSTTAIRRSISGPRQWNAIDVITWVHRPTITDPAASKFLKFDVRGEADNIPVGIPLAIEGLTSAQNLEDAAAVLASAGAQIGLVVHDHGARKYLTPAFRPTSHGYGSRCLPQHSPTNVDIKPVVIFKDYTLLHAVLATSRARAVGQWKICIKGVQNEAYKLPGKAPPIVPRAHIGLRDAPEPDTGTSCSSSNASDESRPHTEMPKQEKIPGESDSDSDNREDTREGSNSDPTIPRSVRDAAKHDIFLRSIVALTDGVTENLSATALDKLEDWRIPEAIAENNQALAWIARHLQPSASTISHYLPNEIIVGKIRNINEQMKLNTMRRAAEALMEPVAQMTSKVFSGSEVKHHDAASLLEEAISTIIPPERTGPDVNNTGELVQEKDGRPLGQAAATGRTNTAAVPSVSSMPVPTLAPSDHSVQEKSSPPGTKVAEPTSPNVHTPGSSQVPSLQPTSIPVQAAGELQTIVVSTST